MATDYSAEYNKRAAERLRFTPLYFRMKFFPWLKKYRSLRRKLAGSKIYPSTTEPVVTKILESGTEHFQKNHWVFLENILSPEFHSEIIQNWPPKYFLTPPKKISKSYNTGFNWTYGGTPPEHLEQFPTLTKFFKYLQSSEFQSRVTNFVGLGKNFVCYSFTINSTYPGSEVLPHKDGIYHNAQAQAFINIVFFIDGTGGKNSGGLMLARDNELKDAIVEPTNLRNTCLIYDSKTDFYHGFRPVERGKFRRAINVQFCAADFVENSNS